MAIVRVKTKVQIKWSADLVENKDTGDFYVQLKPDYSYSFYGKEAGEKLLKEILKEIKDGKNIK